MGSGIKINKPRIQTVGWDETGNGGQKVLIILSDPRGKPENTEERTTYE